RSSDRRTGMPLCSISRDETTRPRQTWRLPGSRSVGGQGLPLAENAGILQRQRSAGTGRGLISAALHFGPIVRTAGALLPNAGRVGVVGVAAVRVGPAFDGSQRRPDQRMDFLTHEVNGAVSGQGVHTAGMSAAEAVAASAVGPLTGT